MPDYRFPIKSILTESNNAYLQASQWARQDSNLGLTDYESAALTD
jgi:hypothetical protein